MMNHPNPALAYRQQAVRSASPLGLVVLLYDTALNSLNRAIRALDAGDIETRIDSLNHVLAVLEQLQQTLNFEHGEEVAANLDRFYNACRATILEASILQSRDLMAGLARQMQGLRDAWKEADRQGA